MAPVTLPRSFQVVLTAGWAVRRVAKMVRSGITAEVRDALVHLHDLPCLQTHPLAETFRVEQPARAGRLLHRRLVEAIEQLRPPDGADRLGHAWRGYELLRLRYVEALDVATARARLALSHGEYYRDHARALEAVASIIGGLAVNGDGPNGGAANGEAPRNAALASSLTSFVGREREVEATIALLQAGRLVTIVGPPGTGKSRLAQEVARRLASGSTRVEVHVVPLAALTDPGAVVPAIGSTVGAPPAVNRAAVETLARHLGGTRALLVLDNLEQVAAVGPELTALLAACPGLRVLGTSRAPLRVAGEQEMPLAPLAVPGCPDDPIDELLAVPSVRLFVDRARAVRPDLPLDDGTLDSVATICRALDGLPLAIELAAVRTRALAPSEIARRLVGRLDLLRDGPRDLPERQRSLRSTLDWSHDLLPPAERRLLRRFAVFAGGWMLDAAEQVAGTASDTVDGLTRLVDSSLVVADLTPGGVRYRLLATIRAYGLEQLAEAGETDQLGERHAEYFLGLVEREHERQRYGIVAEFVDEQERERDNLRAALAWLVTHGDAGRALRLTAGQLWLWMARGPLPEGRASLGQALALPGAGELAAERRAALRALARLARRQGEYAAAASLFEEALAIARTLDDPLGVAQLAFETGHTALELADVARAQGAVEEAMAGARALNERRLIALAQVELGWIAFQSGDLDLAAERYDEAWGTIQRDGFPPGGDCLFDGRGLVWLERGELDRAGEAFRRNLRAALDTGDPAMVAHFLEDLAALAAAQRRPERAMRIAGAASALRERFGAPLPPTYQPRFERWLGKARDRLDAGVAAVRLAEGKELAVEDATEYALGDAD